MSEPVAGHQLFTNRTVADLNPAAASACLMSRHVRFRCGGPAGLTAAVYLVRYRRSVAVYDSGHSRADLRARSLSG
jgi:hypothetical protein